MLVLTRKVEESIIIGDNVEIKILEIRKNSVKIGIIAPKEIKVLRKEVIKEIEKENIEAIGSIDGIKLQNKKVENNTDNINNKITNPRKRGKKYDKGIQDNR